MAGQTAADEDGHVVEREFVAQFDRALGKVVEVVRCAGGLPHHIARMTIYVTDLEVCGNVALGSGMSGDGTWELTILPWR